MLLGYNLCFSYASKCSPDQVRTQLLPNYVKLAILTICTVTLIEFTLINLFGFSYERIYGMQSGHFFEGSLHRALGLAGNASINNALTCVAYLWGLAVFDGKLPKAYTILSLLAFVASFAGSVLFIVFGLVFFYSLSSVKHFSISLVFILPALIYITSAVEPYSEYSQNVGPLSRISLAYFLHNTPSAMIYIGKITQTGLLHIFIGNGPLSVVSDYSEELGVTSDFGIFLTVAEIGLIGLLVCTLLTHFFANSFRIYLGRSQYRLLWCTPYLLLFATLHYSVIFNVSVQVFSGLLWGILFYVNRYSYSLKGERAAPTLQTRTSSISGILS